jgi:hypothetical protein
MFAHQERGVFPDIYQSVLPTDLLHPITVLSTTPIYTNSFLDTSSHTPYITANTSKSDRQHARGGLPEVCWHRAAGQIFDNPSLFSYNNTMLRPAIRKNNLDMVKLLLEYEFDPEGGICPHEQSTYELAYRGSDVQRVVKEAVLAQREVFREYYITPVRNIWNEESQEVELVEYILTPRSRR